MEFFRSRHLSALNRRAVLADALGRNVLGNRKSRGIAVIVVVGINKPGKYKPLAVKFVPGKPVQVRRK